MAHRPARSGAGLGRLVTPAASLAAMAGAWLGPVTPDERAALLTAAAAASTYAALRTPAARRVPTTPSRSDRGARRSESSSKEFSGGTNERVDDLAALIAAW